jgi:hypothetical protein
MTDRGPKVNIYISIPFYIISFHGGGGWGHGAWVREGGGELRRFRVTSGPTDPESFLFRGTAGITPEQTNCSVYSVFR